MSMSNTSSRLLTNTEAAAMLGLKPTTLEIWRTRGKGPEFLKFGSNKQAPVRYHEAIVIAWLEQRTYSSTSAYPVRSETQSVGLRSVAGLVQA